MASAEGDAGEGPSEAEAESPGTAPRTPDRTGSDRRAEALRANLRRRKAQTRARGEARPGPPAAGVAPDARSEPAEPTRDTEAAPRGAAATA